MEEVELLRQFLHRSSNQLWWLPLPIPKLSAEIVRGRGFRERSWRFRPHESRAPSVGDEALAAVLVRLQDARPLRLLSSQSGGVSVGGGVQINNGRGDSLQHAVVPLRP